MANLTSAPAPLLDLTTPRDRLTVTMNAGAFRFRSPYDLTIAEMTHVEGEMARYLELSERGKHRTKKEGEELGTLSKAICRIGLAEGNLQAVGPMGHVVLADFFFDLCLQTNLRLRQVRDQIVQQAGGATPSRVSSASTEGRQARGSQRPRSGHSTRS